MRIVIVGGSTGGVSAATRLRRLDESAEIIIVERSNQVAFANCSLPYFIGGKVKDIESSLAITPNALRANYNLDVRLLHEVESFDALTKTVQVRNLSNGQVEALSFDELILSPGSIPVRPKWPGAERALILRSLAEAQRINAELAGVKKVVVIGGGLINLEVVDNLTRRGISVTLVEAEKQVLPAFDPEMITPVHDHIRANDAELILGHAVVEIVPMSPSQGECALDKSAIGPSQVILDDGRALEADLVILDIGGQPNVAFANASGVELGAQGGIVIDALFQTNLPHVYAIGDTVEKLDANDYSSVLIPRANQASLQGRRVADVICGIKTLDRPVLGTSIVSVFGLQVASTGWSEKHAKAVGRAVHVIHTHQLSSACYYPTATPIDLKIVIDAKTHSILGAQGVGMSGVDKRIDIIATAMMGGLAANELPDLELGYAPQFGVPKAPINMLGFIADSQLHKLVVSLQWHELDDAVRSGASVIDVRTRENHESFAIEGSISVPLDELRSRLDELPAGELIVYCATGVRGYLAARILRQNGRKVRNLDGGIETWKAGVASLE